jgi:hypothetical protein
MNNNLHINPTTNGKYADLTKRQAAFVDSLIDNGHSGYTLHRQGLAKTAEACGYPGNFPWPSWITASKERRIDRGIFSLPELGERVNDRATAGDLPSGYSYKGCGLMEDTGSETNVADCYRAAYADDQVPTISVAETVLADSVADAVFATANG